MAAKKNQEMSELDRLLLEEKKLQLESLRFTVENERARREQILRNHKQQQEALDSSLRKVQAEQKICKHKKGGKNLAGILNGTDSEYSVIQHTYPWGETAVTCTRCGKDWREPSKELKKSDPEAYKAQMAEYVAALNFPTDNEPSGTRLFVITREPVGATA